jgi:GNAT superfamily N-acetyltransferase
MAGWGMVSEKRWPYPKSADWPIPEPPGLDGIAKFNRVFAYFRVRHVSDGRLCLFRESPFTVSIPIHGGWYKAVGGVIELPTHGQPFTSNHCVCVEGYDDSTQAFRFANSWGTSWGDKGFGYLPYEYFTKYVQEAWFLRPSLAANTNQPEHPAKDGFIGTFGEHINELGHRCMICSAWDLASNTRVGWSFATMRDGYFDIEEMFVRPEYRGQGHGGMLMSQLLEESDKLQLPVRFWIPHADFYPKTASLLPINHLFTKNGFIVATSGVTWALYRAEQRDEATAAEDGVKLTPPSAIQVPPAGMCELDTGMGDIKPESE